MESWYTNILHLSVHIFCCPLQSALESENLPVRECPERFAKATANVPVACRPQAGHPPPQPGRDWGSITCSVAAATDRKPPGAWL